MFYVALSWALWIYIGVLPPNDNWFVTNHLGITKVIIFYVRNNKSYLDHEWEDLREFYKFSGNCWVLFKHANNYNSNYNFWISIFDDTYAEVKHHGWPVKVKQEDVEYMSQLFPIPQQLEIPIIYKNEIGSAVVCWFENDDDNNTNIISNVVYKDIFRNVI